MTGAVPQHWNTCLLCWKVLGFYPQYHNAKSSSCNMICSSHSISAAISCHQHGLCSWQWPSHLSVPGPQSSQGHMLPSPFPFIPGLQLPLHLLWFWSFLWLHGLTVAVVLVLKLTSFFFNVFLFVIIRVDTRVCLRCTCVSVCHSIGQLWRSRSLIPSLHGSQGSNSDCQTYKQVSLLTESSWCPLCFLWDRILPCSRLAWNS